MALQQQQAIGHNTRSSWRGSGEAAACCDSRSAVPVLLLPQLLVLLLLCGALASQTGLPAVAHQGSATKGYLYEAACCGCICMRLLAVAAFV
jgi:hypothetical protein